jgi:dihydrofolate reductase
MKDKKMNMNEISELLGLSDKHIADVLYLTEIDYDFDCDTFFPEVDSKKWIKIFKSEIRIDEKSGLKYTFNIYEKRKK